MTSDHLICLATITSAHGIRGAVHAKTFTETPESLKDYNPLQDKNGNTFRITRLRQTKGDMVVLELEGITSRNQAESLRNTSLFVPRSALPHTEEEEFYYEDLTGLEVRSSENRQVYGKVDSIQNHGGGDIIEIKTTTGTTELYPFTKAIFPEIRISEGYITFFPPEYIYAEEEE